MKPSSSARRCGSSMLQCGHGGFTRACRALAPGAGHDRRCAPVWSLDPPGEGPAVLARPLDARRPALSRRCRIRILAWTLFHERVQPAQLGAAPCIAAGLYLMLT